VADRACGGWVVYFYGIAWRDENVPLLGWIDLMIE
jgi:hypothetical protein